MGFLILTLIIPLTDVQKSFMDGRCHQLCIDENLGDKGSYNEKAKICECLTSIEIDILDLPKFKTQKKVENKESPLYRW